MLLHLLYLLAIVAEAMSGALMGMRRGMDRFGLCLVGTVTALGGGTVRDVLLGHYPLRGSRIQITFLLQSERRRLPRRARSGCATGKTSSSPSTRSV